MGKDGCQKGGGCLHANFLEKRTQEMDRFNKEDGRGHGQDWLRKYERIVKLFAQSGLNFCGCVSTYMATHCNKPCNKVREIDSLKKKVEKAKRNLDTWVGIKKIRSETIEAIRNFLTIS